MYGAETQSFGLSDPIESDFERFDDSDGEPGGEPEDSVEATWFLFDEPEMDDRLKEAGGSLDEMFDRLGTKPCVIWDAAKGGGSLGQEDMLFLARYEFPAFNKSFKHIEAVSQEFSLGFIDFLGGMPYSAVEIMGLIGEISTDGDELSVKEPEDGAASPPIPDDLFEGFNEGMELYNHLWLVTAGERMECTVMAEGLRGQKVPVKPHWWYRVEIKKQVDIHWPVPGEFMALAPRIAPYLPWGTQESNPFLFSGNWMETLHYTNCRILKVIDPTKSKPYPRYEVQYRKYGSDKKNRITATPTDFAEYKVGDRVAIIRNEGSDKQSWKWDDLKEFDEETWTVAPIDFYGKLTEDKGDSRTD